MLQRVADVVADETGEDHCVAGYLRGDVEDDCDLARAEGVYSLALDALVLRALQRDLDWVLADVLGNCAGS